MNQFIHPLPHIEIIKCSLKPISPHDSPATALEDVFGEWNQFIKKKKKD